MKDQYFADERDFLKYDLWIELARQMGHSASLTFIPMLTPNDETGHGNKRGYECGTRDRKLFDFLRGWRDEENRKLSRLRDFLNVKEDSRSLFYPYRDGCSSMDYFSHKERDSYFREIPADWLKSSIILIDPDNGLETKSNYWKKHPEKYVLYCEVASIAARCCGAGVIVVVQFPLRNADLRSKGLEFRAHNLRDRIGGWDIHWIAPMTSNGKVGDVAFFILAAESKGTSYVKGFVSEYARRHHMMWE